MEKQACHVEWGRLKISRRPVLTGAATGSSQLMRVACRTSPCLVHLFEDSNLVSIWRFPSDPIFLLFGPSFHQRNVEDIAGDSKSSDCSLLVITSDGSVWLLHCWREYDPSTERITKKRKEAVPEALQKAVQDTLDESDMKPLRGERSSQPKQWDNLQEFNIHGSQMPGLLVRFGGRTRSGECDSSKVEGCDVDPPTSKLRTKRTHNSSDVLEEDFTWKEVSSNIFPRVDSKLKVKMVPEEALQICVPGTLVAAFGPNDSVALLGVSGALRVIQVSSSCLSRSISTESEKVSFCPVAGKESGCLLFASAQCNADEQLEEYVALLEAKFFRNLFGFADSSAASFGILHGDTEGHLYTSLISPELALFHTKLLCDFGQPVVAAFAVPTPAAPDKDRSRSEEDSMNRKHHGSSLLIIGQLGKVILLTGLKETVVPADDDLFWPTSKTFSWKFKGNTVTARHLNDRNLDFFEWEVFSPVSFACMLGPHRLCYCTRSEIFYTDLLENVDISQPYPHISRTKRTTGVEPKDSLSLSLLKLSQRLQTSVSKDSSVKRLFRKELLSQKVPLVDVVVAIAGRGVSFGVGSRRPLVALTTRGRLLGVEVSHHVSSRALSIAGGIPKSWRTLLSRMEDKIQGLVQVVGEVAQSTQRIKNHSAAINLALNELATALPLARDICLYEMRVRRPDTSLVGEPPAGKIHSFLTVTDYTSAIISQETLCFGPSSLRFTPSSSFYSRKVKISIRVCNQSRRVLSSYWSLLLELRCENSTASVQFSSPINGGLGLSVGAEYAHEFIAQLPAKGLGPVMVYVFLCHHQDYHDLVAHAELSPVSSDETCHHKKMNELRSKLIDSSSNNLGTIHIRAGSDRSSQTSGVVCVALSQYRIDLLSILQVTAPRLRMDTRFHLSSRAEKHPNLDVASVPQEHYLKRFSSRIILYPATNSPYTGSKDIAKLWQDLYLDDLPRRGIASNAGQKVTVSAYDSETFAVTLKSETAGKKCTVVEVILESSSLLLGSYLREAIMWRLDHCKDIFSPKCCPWQQTAENVEKKNLSSELAPNTGDTVVRNFPESSEVNSEDTLAESTPKVMDAVAEIDERLALISELWGDVVKFPDRAQFTSLLKETCAAVQDVMLVYRTCRAEESQRPMVT